LMEPVDLVQHTNNLITLNEDVGVNLDTSI
jgi:hypothetical protein